MMKTQLNNIINFILNPYYIETVLLEILRNFLNILRFLYSVNNYVIQFLNLYHV